MLDISVVVPLHNAAPLITRTLDSFAGQTVPPREVVVVDDGSTDDGVKLAESYRFPWGQSPVVLRNAASEGVARARNRGVFHAKGEWVGLCDSDDLWHPRRIEMLADLVQRRPEVRAIATAATGFALEEDRSILEHHQRAPMIDRWVPDDQVTTLVDALGDLGASGEYEVTFADLQQDTVFPTTQLCVRRELYVLAGGCAPWCFRAGDYLLNACVAANDPIVTLRAPLVFYRVRAQSLSHDDRETALPILSAVLALRFGGATPDPRPAGAIYRHLVGSDVRNGAPIARTLALAALGTTGRDEIWRVTKLHLRRRFLDAMASRRSMDR